MCRRRARRRHSARLCPPASGAKQRRPSLGRCSPGHWVGPRPKGAHEGRRPEPTGGPYKLSGRSFRPIPRAQHTPGLPDPVQDPVCHPGGHPFTGPRNWRELGHILVIRPDAPAAPAGGRTRSTGELRCAGTQAGLLVVQPGRRLQRDLLVSDVSRSRAGADQLHGHCGPSPVRRQPGLQGPDRERRGAGGVGQLLPGAGHQPGAWPPAGARRRQDGGRALRHRPQPRVLAPPLQRGRQRPERLDHHQRPCLHGGGRGAAWLRRHHPGRAAAGVRAPHDACADAAGPPGQRLRESPLVLGLPLRPAQARRVDRPGQGGAERPLPRPPQGRRGAAAARRERPDHAALPGEGSDDAARPARPERPAPRGPGPAADPAGRYRHRAADCVREHRQPAAGARRGPRLGDGGAPVDWRQPRPVDDAVAGGVVPALGDGGGVRDAGGQVDARRDWLARAARGGGHGGLHARPLDAAVCRRTGARHGADLRAVPGRLQHAPRPGAHAQEPGRPARRRARGQALPHDAGHRADCHVDGAARARGPLRQEPGEREPRRLGPEHRESGHLRRGAGAERL